jgi:hypothetical protein
VQILHPPQKSEVRHFGTVKAKEYDADVTLKGMAYLLTFMKNLTTVSKVISWGHTDRQYGDLISLSFLFKESRLRSSLLRTCNRQKVIILAQGFKSFHYLIFTILLLLLSTYVHLYQRRK